MKNIELLLLTISIISFGVIFMMYSIRNRIWMAAAKGDLRTVKHLIKNGTSVQQGWCKASDVNAKDENGDTALMFASQEGHLDIVKYLQSKGATE